MRSVLAAAVVVLGLSRVASAAETAPSEPLYVGYYKEDPVDNPEDPTIGALYLKLPLKTGVFTGNMSFTYVGCQTSNVGTISGAMTGDELQGTWTGTTDGTLQHGDFIGRRTAPRDVFAGDYNVAGGKQHIVVPGCIEYYVASRGTFELFAAGTSEPSNFVISLLDRSVSWAASAGTLMTLVSVLDPELAHAGQGNATVWQTLVMGDKHTAKLDATKLVKGHGYLATVGTVDQSFKRISFGSVAFVAP